jgi:sugar lactone lactonase YvrE
MKKTTILLTILYLAIGLKGQVYQSEKLEKLWETTGLSVPESVLPVPEEGILYVSNIGNTNSSSKDGTGFISILSVNGKIKTLKWATGLNAPKGMAIFNGKLYVTEVDHISEIDLATGKKLNSLPVEGAVFLNDVAAHASGAIFFTDSRTGKVHKLENGKVSTAIQEKDFPNPNGIVALDKKLLIGTGDKVVRYSVETGEVSDYMLNTGGVDGLAKVDKGIILFSDWPGKVHIMKRGEEKELLLDTSGTEKSKTADFGYIADKQLVFIPTFFGNSVVCYKLKL